MKIDESIRKTMKEHSSIISGATGCILWSGAIHGTPIYGKIHRGNKCYQAHRIAYEIAYGPIAEGLIVDHLCRNTLCVNPKHLDVTTRKTNVIRGKRGVLKSHCRSGHLFDESNTYIPPKEKRRICRKCALKRGRRYA